MHIISDKTLFIIYFYFNRNFIYVKSWKILFSLLQNLLDKEQPHNSISKTSHKIRQKESPFLLKIARPKITRLICERNEMQKSQLLKRVKNLSNLFLQFKICLIMVKLRTVSSNIQTFKKHYTTIKFIHTNMDKMITISYLANRN